ncbi:MAG: sodium-extruding oxaloacetate decarboxylase subunit alpha [Candidatus Dormibacteria bacterium]
MPRLELVETALRGGQQAILLSRLRRRHLLPVVEALDRCGLGAIDAFGGSTFEACLRFLAEEPFERLRAIRAAAPETDLLAVLAGQALVGHQQVADDLVDAFIRIAAEAGVDVFRVHDPLNDVRNLERPLAAIHAAGRAAQAAIVYTESPVHSVAGFVTIGRKLAELGYDALCVWDELGLLGAGSAAELVRGLVTETDIPVSLSAGSLTGQSGLAYLAAAQAGAHALDVALSPLAGGASTPPSEGVLHALRGTGVECLADPGGLDLASAILATELSHYVRLVDPTAGRLDGTVLRSGLHPSTVRHLIVELEARQMLDHLAEAEAEVGRVRAELGHPPLVTPIAEIVATQAVYNVCDGDRYATISQQVKDYCLGLYGTPPASIDAHVRRAVNGREEAITCRPADLLEPGLTGARRALEREGIEVGDDEAGLVTYALFPDEYLALRSGAAPPELLGDEPAADPEPASPDGSEAEGADTPPAETEPATPPPPPDEVRELTVEVDGEAYAVRVIAPAGTLGGGVRTGVGSVVNDAPVVREGTVLAPMQGLILKVAVKAGQAVQIGETLAVLEAMKMQNDITAVRAGTVSKVFVKEGDVVAAKAPIAQVG